MYKDCTIYRTANFIGKKWTLLILLELYKGEKKVEDNWRRYSEIKAGLEKITPKVLSARLKELEKEKMIIKKIDASSFPIKSEYSLTNSGKEFIKIIQQMKKWGLKWKYKNKICENADCSECQL